MGKVTEDKIQSTTLDPLVLNPRTVNTYKDNTILSKDELEVANNVIFDNGLIEKVYGSLQANSDTPGAAVMGLHRAYGPSTEKVALRLANGSLKSGPPAFATTVLSGLATDKITPFINIRGKSWGINETDGLIRYDPKTGVGLKTAITGPFLRKKIAFFESDETWTGGTADNGAYRPDEWSGKSVTSRKLSATASGNDSSVSNITVDLSQFLNSKASDDNDLINIYTKHSIYNNIDHITVEFSSGGTTFATKFMVSLYRADFTGSDYQWTEWKIKKGAFVKTGSPSWATIQAVRLTVYANASGTAAISFDYMYLSAAPLGATELLIEIFDAETNTNETWGGNTVLDNSESYSGFRSASLNGANAVATASLALGTALDLTKWATGVSTSDSDEFVFYIYTNDESKLTDASCLTLRVGTDSGNYYYYTWATKSALGLTINNQWIEVRVKKSVLAGAQVGTPNYNSIAYIAFVTSSLAAGGNLWFDHMTLQQYGSAKQICDFESTETWVITGGGQVAGGLTGWAGTGGVTKGSQCLQLWDTGPVSTATYDCPLVDLTQWDDGSSSTTDDFICFDFYMIYPTALFIYLEIWFDNNSLATFANAYKHRVLPSDLILNESSTYAPRNIYGEYITGQVGTVPVTRMTIKVPKSVFEKVGAAGGWNTIGAIRFVSSSAGSPVWPQAMFIDNVRMARKTRTSAMYYYKYCFMVNDIHSALSDVSDVIQVATASILLNNIKTSQDSRVTARKIFRLGGIYPNTWMFVKTIDDNTTTYLVDDVEDTDLSLSMGDEVPTGNIDIVKGNNLSYDPSTDRLMVWGDPDHKTYIRYSPSGFYNAFGESSYREMSDNVMNVQSWYAQKFIWYQQKMQKISGDITTGELIDLPENVGACSYWSVKPINNMILFAGWDNVYSFDGYNAVAIGEEIKNYFKGRETYLSSVNLAYCKDTLYIACKAKTGTPTYNTVVLRYYIPTKSWSIIPEWNVNIWSNWDQSDDLNDLYYGDSVTGNIFSINYSTYQFGGSAITAQIELGWINIPNSEIAIHSIEFKAKGTAASTLNFAGYKNMITAASVCSGSISLTASWLTYTLGPKNIHNIMRGDNLKVVFSHATDSAYFKMKDLVVNLEAIPKRITLNEVAVTLT